MTDKPSNPRRSVLDLAPLELDCMNTLWPMGEGTVRQIRDQLAARRPRAYTTIMTIMDRLARKGVVERRKFGRAYIYRPNLSADEARTQALGQVVENFFGGSREALIRVLGASTPYVAHLFRGEEFTAHGATSAASAAAAAGAFSSAPPSLTSGSATSATSKSLGSAPEPEQPRTPRPAPPAVRPPAPVVPSSQPAPTDLIDDTLL